MIDRKTRVILALVFCPISGIPTYVTMCALMHTPITWVYWIGLVVTQCAGCTVSIFYQDIVHGIAHFIRSRVQIAQTEPKLRYELVMHDEGMVSGNDEVDHGKVGVN